MLTKPDVAKTNDHTLW